jgi:large subunit ribosomal protein L13
MTTATKYTIDANGKKLGRIAAQAAHILMGKNTVSYARNAAPSVTVVVENASKLSLTERKLAENAFTYHSGFPGGIRFETLERAIEKHGIAEVVRRTVSGMLPKNKLRARMIKNLVVTE